MAACLGVLLGWPVAGLAFSPFALYILFSPQLTRSFQVLFISMGAVLPLLVLTDTYFYGKPTVRSLTLYA